MINLKKKSNFFEWKLYEVFKSNFLDSGLFVMDLAQILEGKKGAYCPFILVAGV